MIDFEGRLAAIAPSWPGAAAELAELKTLREQYDEMVQTRGQTQQAARNAGAVRNAVKERYLTMYAEVIARVQAEFPRDNAALLGEKRQEEADRLAGAIFGLLSLAMAVFCALGIAATPGLVDWVTPGFVGDGRALTITLVRIVFPGTALLVLSAWCLGILNSHRRRFFLSCAAPVVWNLTIILALVIGHRP